MTQIERLIIWSLLAITFLSFSGLLHEMVLHDARIRNIEMAK